MQEGDRTFYSLDEVCQWLGQFCSPFDFLLGIKQIKIIYENKINMSRNKNMHDEMWLCNRFMD
jgi:hypothetical protein